MCTALSKYRAPRKRTHACAHMHKSGLAKFMPVSCSSVGIRACTAPRESAMPNGNGVPSCDEIAFATLR